MTAVTVMHGDERRWLPWTSSGWTVDDLEGLPDDGLQYELFDGVLIVSPSPIPIHQRAVLELAFLLRENCPAELEIFVAPMDFQPTQTRSMQPDLLVVRRAEVGRRKLEATPLLALDVLSDCTRSKDLIIKPAVYRDGGVDSYWILDPGDPDTGAEPRFTAHELEAGDYREVAAGSGTDRVAVDHPYPVVVCPSEIVAG